jgi:hypothetical protein
MATSTQLADNPYELKLTTTLPPGTDDISQLRENPRLIAQTPLTL